MTDTTPQTMTIAEANALLTAPGQEFEIREATIDGRRIRIWANATRSLREVLQHGRAHGEKTFLVYEDERLAFDAHHRAVAAFAARLAGDFGIRKGDRVAIAMRNYPEWSIAFWGASAVGAVVVPLNAWWKGAELEYGLRDSGARFLVADAERLAEVRDRLAGLGLTGVAVARADETRGEGVVAFDELTAGAAELPDVEIEPEDDATIFYTSGTTGLPKGALGTHRNVCSNLATLEFLGRRREVMLGIEPEADPPQPASLLTVPFFHVTGCHSTLVPSLKTGGKLVLVYRFDPSQAVELIEREGISSFGGVPAIAWHVLEAPNFTDHDLSSVLRIGYGGAPAAPDLVSRLQTAFPGVALSNGYGLTESSSVTSSNAGDDYLRKPSSVGPPVPVCEVRVVDDGGEDVEPGAPGELWIRGPNIVRGYWNKPEATAETITDGWLHSGDMVRVDEDGFLYLVDRKKDIVIRGGENVYCVEVEAALCEHPQVLDAAVFGLPHRILGEEVAAAVKVRVGAQVTEDEILAHTRERLARFKVPVRIAVREDDFPRNANGKTLKRELREAMIAAAGRGDGEGGE